MPGLRGLAAVAKTGAGVRTLSRDAVPLHLREVRRSGEPIPDPTSLVEYVDVQSAP